MSLLHLFKSPSSFLGLLQYSPTWSFFLHLLPALICPLPSHLENKQIITQSKTLITWITSLPTNLQWLHIAYSVQTELLALQASWAQGLSCFGLSFTSVPTLHCSHNSWTLPTNRTKLLFAFIHIALFSLSAPSLSSLLVKILEDTVHMPPSPFDEVISTPPARKVSLFCTSNTYYI